MSEEGELFELISESTHDKLGCKVCAVAVRDDDGAFWDYAASSRVGAETTVFFVARC